jgi:hypothetical protein
MPIQEPPEPPTQEELEVQLRQTLAQMDEERAVTIAAADAQIAQRLGALPTAGNQYNDRIAQAEQGYSDGQDAYGELLGDTQAKLDAAQGAIDAIDTNVPSIGSVGDIAINPTDAPDCSAGDVEAAVNGALSDIRKMRDDIVAALDAIVGGNVVHQKDALQSLKDAGQAFRDPMPDAQDVEAEKAARHAELQGLYP